MLLLIQELNEELKQTGSISLNISEGLKATLEQL